ncbi:hypothetical protein C8A01DRAFT_21001, partial [Parachaetomium inaequale]
RTYRTRKDQYAKSLENEVARLRTIETNLVRETQRLRATVQTLGNCLADYGIDVPTGLGGDEGVSEPDASFAGHHPSGSSHRGKVTQLDVSPHRDGPPVLPRRNAPSGALQVPAIPVTSRHGSARLGDLDPTTVGMEFVLALEAPCLDHIHGDPDNQHQPSGHALTISAHLLFLSPQSPSPPDARTLNEACGRAPASILSRLLTLSTNLALEDEVTPVQAWNHIRCQPHFGGLEVDRLRSLTKKLGEAVKCHGFGTVFKGKVFEKLVREALLDGRSF